MANLFPPQYPQQIDLFSSGNPTQSQRAFGFGAAFNNLQQQLSFAHHTTSPPHHLTQYSHVSSHNPSSPRGLAGSKRRHDRDDEDEDDEGISGGGDHGDADRRSRARTATGDAMDRSPTPERPKRTAPKRMRVAPDGDNGATKEDQENNKAQEDTLDVGVLLAGLPPQSLLPILTALLAAQPQLKPVLLSLIPRPTLDTALRTLADAAKKLREAYPYSQSATSLSQSFASTSFGFGSATPSFLRPASTFGSFGSATQQQPRPAGMRDEYVMSRLRPHISDFISTAKSYLSYFSLIPSPNAQPPSALGPALNPSETFSFLSALTNHIASQPPLSVTALEEFVQERVTREWQAWLARVDTHVNKEGGMYPAGMVRTWERDLDMFAAQSGAVGTAMKAVRDEWVARVGWLIGRRARSVDMEGDEEL